MPKQLAKRLGRPHSAIHVVPSCWRRRRVWWWCCCCWCGCCSTTRGWATHNTVIAEDHGMADLARVDALTRGANMYRYRSRSDHSRGLLQLTSLKMSLLMTHSRRAVAVPFLTFAEVSCFGLRPTWLYLRAWRVDNLGAEPPTSCDHGFTSGDESCITLQLYPLFYYCNPDHFSARTVFW